MDQSRVSLGSVAASTAMLCVLSLAPAPLSPSGGFLVLPQAHAQCCSATQTQILFVRGSEYPVSGVLPGGRTNSRDDGISRGYGAPSVPQGTRIPVDIDQQALFFTTVHPVLTSGGRKALDRVETRIEMQRVAVAEVTAGNMPATASGGLGETADRLVLAPAVTVGALQRVRGDLLALANAHEPVSRPTAPSEGASGASSATLTAQGTQTTDGAQTGDDTRASVDQSAPTEGAKDTTGETGEFSGSSAPAGPDLTTSEEQEAIAHGWK